MTDPLSDQERAELRRRAEWIREHHDDTNRPARILVEADDAIALLDALDVAEAESRAAIGAAARAIGSTEARARRDAALADLMATERYEGTCRAVVVPGGNSADSTAE